MSHSAFSCCWQPVTHRQIAASLLHRMVELCSRRAYGNLRLRHRHPDSSAGMLTERKSPREKPPSLTGYPILEVRFLPLCNLLFDWAVTEVQSNCQRPGSFIQL